MLKLHVLASGSGGNAAVVEDDATDACLLIDCGICARDMKEGLAGAGITADRVTDILVSHEHSDHTKGLGVCVRALIREGATPTIHTSRAVHNASRPLREALKSDEVGLSIFKAGGSFKAGSMTVHAFPTSHDAAESFGFRIECGEKDTSDALGYLTDTGYVTHEAHEALQYVRILALEANHDLQMLREGPYPFHLQQRIMSEVGHLSNQQASEELSKLLEGMGGFLLEHVVAMHVSRENNLYMLAKESLAETLSNYDHPACAYVARQVTPLSVG